MNETGVFPLIRYRDVTKAVHWLMRCFGFNAYNLVKNSDNTIAYAELSYGAGVFMIGPVGLSSLDEMLKQPHEINGINTQCSYVSLKDIESHYRQSCREGAEIILELRQHDNGDHTYVARDIEGHLWNFGTYSPQTKLEKTRQTKQLNGTYSSDFPKNQNSKFIAMFAMITLLVGSSVIFVNSNFTFSRPSKISPTPSHSSEIKTNQSKIDTISQDLKYNSTANSDNDQVSSSNREERNQSFSESQEMTSFSTPQTKRSWNMERTEKKTPDKKPDFISSTQPKKNIKDVKTTEVFSHQNNESTSENSQDVLTSKNNNVTTSAHELPRITGSIGDQPSEDPSVSPEEPLPPVTLPRTIPSEIKVPNVKKAVQAKKNKTRGSNQKIIPSANKKKNSPSTEKTLFYLFN